MTDYTLVGQIINTHGIKGGLRVYPYTFDINRFFEYGDIYIGDAKIECSIEDVSIHKNIVIMYLKGYDNINQVLEFKESFVYIRRDQEAVLEEGSYYIDDLIQCKVYNLEGEEIGTLTNVLKGSGADVYEITDESGYYLVPAVSVFVKEVNIKEKTIIVDLIDGMYNEN